MEANWEPEEVVKMVNTPLTREPRGWCPLHIAASGGHLQAVRMLLEPGKMRADVHFSVGTPALHLAAAGGHKDVCQLLLDAGADVSGVACHTYMWGRSDLFYKTNGTCRKLLQLSWQLVFTAHVSVLSQWIHQGCTWPTKVP
jgi:ankyrin repeat protein